MANIEVITKKTSFKGLVPIIKNIVGKSLYGDDYEYLSPITGDGILQQDGYTTQNFFQFLTGSHSFNRRALRYLVETGYTNNPAGFGIINKILLAQKNIVFTPYYNGKPWKSKSFDLDINYALLMLLTTGTVFIYSKEIVGFPSEYQVLNTCDIQELYVTGVSSYTLNLKNGRLLPLDSEKLVIIKFADICNQNTNMGLSPFQAALMPIEALQYMYLADTATLKNKGVDGLLTNDNDDPLLDGEKGTFDNVLNERIGGARKSGRVATTSAKLRFIQLGKSAKELALWDGYKIKLRDLCNVLQVDSGQFNDPDNKKFANVQESNKALYNDCVIPFTRMITENKDFKKMIGYDVYLDTSGIDSLQEAQAIRFEKNKTITDTIVALNTQVKAGQITYEVAVRLLVTEWGFDEEEAKQMIVLREIESNETADKLNALSPLVATKVMEQLQIDEIRDLVGKPSVPGGNMIPSTGSSF